MDLFDFYSGDKIRGENKERSSILLNATECYWLFKIRGWKFKNQRI